MKVGLLGVPLDLGAGRRGTDMGPSALRLAGIAGALEALGVTVQDHDNLAAATPETRGAGDPKLRFGRAIRNTCRRLRDRVRRLIDQGQLPLVLGGDHSIAMGSVAGVSGCLLERGEELGLLWIDAHADLNTPATSPSGNVHGMPLAVLLGKGAEELLALSEQRPAIDPAHTALLGLREIDPGECDRIRRLGVRIFTMKDLDEQGSAASMREALAHVTTGTGGFHLSFDLDALDPEIAPGVGTPVRGGLTYREAHLLCELVAEAGAMVSMDVVEINPILDLANRTADLAVELVASALGKRIF